jgi:hypothetical protein
LTTPRNAGTGRPKPSTTPTYSTRPGPCSAGAKGASPNCSSTGSDRRHPVRGMRGAPPTHRLTTHYDRTLGYPDVAAIPRDLTDRDVVTALIRVRRSGSRVGAAPEAWPVESTAGRAAWRWRGIPAPMCRGSKGSASAQGDIAGRVKV